MSPKTLPHSAGKGRQETREASTLKPPPAPAQNPHRPPRILTAVWPVPRLDSYEESRVCRPLHCAGRVSTHLAWSSQSLRNGEATIPILLKGKLRHRELKSVQFSHSIVSNSLRPHEPQHTRPPCPLPTPRVHPNPCPLSR